MHRMDANVHGTKETTFELFWQGRIQQPITLAADAGQDEFITMAVRPGGQPDQALPGVIPELRLGVARQPIVAAVLDFSRDLHLPWLNMVQLRDEILSRIGVNERHA